MEIFEIFIGFSTKNLNINNFMLYLGSCSCILKIYTSFVAFIFEFGKLEGIF